MPPTLHTISSAKTKTFVKGFRVEIQNKWEKNLSSFLVIREYKTDRGVGLDVLPSMMVDSKSQNCLEEDVETFILLDRLIVKSKSESIIVMNDFS